MINSLSDLKRATYMLIVFLLIPIGFLQAQNAFEKLPNIKTLPAKALKQVEQHKKEGLMLTDVPAAIFINNYRDKDVRQFNRFNKLEKEIFKFSGFDGAVSASFPMMTISSMAISFKNGGQEYVLDSVYMPECGIILSNGKEAPIIIRGFKNSYLPDFKTFFGVQTTEDFQRIISRFEKKADKESNKQFKKDFKNAVNKIDENEGEPIAFPKDAVYDANENILKTLFGEDEIYPDYKTLNKTKQVYIEYTEGSWEGRNYTFEYDRQRRITGYKRSLYDNTNIDTYKIKYAAEGLIKKIDHMSERTDINSKSYETILIKTPDSLTLRVLLLPSKGQGAFVTTELDDIYSYDFYFNNLYQLREMKWFSGKKALNDTKYYYENKNLVKKEWTVFDNDLQPIMFTVYNYSYNKKNEIIGRSYDYTQKDRESYKGSYVVSSKGESEVGKEDNLIISYTYDTKGRKVLVSNNNKDFAYKIKFTYEDF